MTISSIDPTETVASITLRMPAAARTFERYGIDFCCRGRVPLELACSQLHVPLDEVLDDLKRETADSDEPPLADTTAASLIEYIVSQHHVYTRNELARLLPLSVKVERVHGTRHRELVELRSTLALLSDDLLTHMLKEEKVLFPYVEALERGRQSIPPFRTVHNPLHVLTAEHEEVGTTLDKLRRLTSDYVAPADACTSYRVLYAGIEGLAKDLHMHVHLENNVLFPLAERLEQRLFGR